MNHLINIILISLFCCGWVKVISKDMIFEFIGIGLAKLPKVINKPLGGCVPCSASIIGTVGYFILIFANIIHYSIALHLFYCISCMIVNLIIWFLMEYLVISVQIKRKQLGIKL